jgi:hypothetical protein
MKRLLLVTLIMFAHSIYGMEHGQDVSSFKNELHDSDEIVDAPLDMQEMVKQALTKELLNKASEIRKNAQSEDDLKQALKLEKTAHSIRVYQPQADGQEAKTNIIEVTIRYDERYHKPL